MAAGCVYAVCMLVAAELARGGFAFPAGSLCPRPAAFSRQHTGGGAAQSCHRREKRLLQLRMANPWDTTGSGPSEPIDNDMFSMPKRNESKMGEATETLRRDFKQQVAESQALPGFLRGALDPLRLKRNVKESRVVFLSRMLKGVRKVLLRPAYSSATHPGARLACC